MDAREAGMWRGGDVYIGMGVKRHDNDKSCLFSFTF